MPKMRQTRAQRISALASANRVRTNNTATLRRIRKLGCTDGYREAERTLRRFSDPDIGSLRLGWFLRAIYRVGTATVAEILEAAAISRVRETRPLGVLTAGERSRVASVLRARAERRR